MATKLYQFNVDLSCVPYVKGDIAPLTAEEKKAVDAEVKARKLEGDVITEVKADKAE